MKLTIENRSEIAVAYRDNLEPMASIAQRFGVSRMAVHKVLRKQGVDTSKAVAAHINIHCDQCGRQFNRKRCTYRNRGRRVFCSHACYTAWLNRSPCQLIISNKGMRRARKIVSEFFALIPGCVVHHEDRNDLNNDLANLRVFKNQKDHVQYHRGVVVSPIWDGRLCQQ